MMKKTKLILGLTLVVLFVMSLGSMALAADNDTNTTESTSTVTEDSDTSQIKTVINQYINMECQIHVNGDISLFDDSLFISSTSKTSDMNYIYNKYDYKVKKREYFNYYIQEDYKLDIEYKSIDIEKDKATVSLYRTLSYLIPLTDNDNWSVFGDDYSINLLKENDGWKIQYAKTSDEIDEIYYGSQISPDSMIEELNNIEDVVPQIDPQEYTYSSNIRSFNISSLITNGIKATLLTRYDYDRNRAASYAHTYALHANKNTLFEDWISENTDCQNYASQVVWYGCDGTNTSTAIYNMYLPMTNTTGRVWYQRGPGYATGSAWASVSNFRTYIENSSAYLPGPLGWANNSSLSFAMKGDVLQYNFYYNGSQRRHSVVVYNATGTYGAETASTLIICAHTSQRDCVLLADAYGEPYLSNFNTIRIVSYRE